MPENNPFQPFDISGVTGVDPDASSSISIAAGLDPMKEAHLKELSAKTGFDLEILRGLRPEDLRPIEENPTPHVTTPAMKKYYSDPNRAAISFDDAFALGNVEGAFGQFTQGGAVTERAQQYMQEGVRSGPAEVKQGVEIGQLGIRRGDLGVKAMQKYFVGDVPTASYGDMDDHEVAAIDERLKAYAADESKRGLLSQTFSSTGYLAGMSSMLMGKALPDIAAGTAGAAVAVGLVSGAAPTLAALSPVIAPIAAVSSAKQMFNVEAGNAFLDLRNEKDELGRGVDPGAAVVAASLVGLANTGLELAGMRALSKLPVIGKAFGAFTGEEVMAGAKLMLKDPTARARMLEIFKNSGKAILGETSTEALQELPGQLAAYITKAQANKAGSANFKLPTQFLGWDTPEAIVNLKPLADVAKTTALGGFGLSFLPTVHALRGTYAEVEAAKVKYEGLLGVRDTLQAAQTMGRSPAALKDLIGILSEQAPPESKSLWVDGKDALELFQTDKTAFDRLGITESELTEAAGSGDAIEIKTDRLLSELVAPELNAQFNSLAGILKAAPAALSKNEGDALQSPEAMKRVVELFQQTNVDNVKLQDSFTRLAKEAETAGLTEDAAANVLSAVERFAYRQILDGRPVEEVINAWERFEIRKAASLTQAQVYAQLRGQGVPKKEAEKRAAETTEAPPGPDFKQGQSVTTALRVETTTPGRFVDVVVNPTSEDYAAMSKRFRETYPQALTGEPKTRRTSDSAGNTYVWMAGDGTHAEVEPALSTKVGPVNQNVSMLAQGVQPLVSPATDMQGLDQSFAQTRGLGFYSTLETFVMADNFKSIGAADLLKRLEGAYQKGTIKKEEIDDTGLIDWLTALGTERVTKEQVNAFIVERGPRVEDHTLGYLDPAEAERRMVGQIRVEEVDGEFAWTREVGEEPFWNGGFATRAEAEEDARQALDDEIGMMPPAALGGGKFSQYASDRLENYREVLLRLPGRKESVGSHWDQTGVFAHVRLSDKTQDGKKVLFIEEIQSDWHQAGRDRGYAGAPVRPEVVSQTWQAAAAALKKEDYLGFDSAGQALRAVVDEPGDFSKLWEFTNPDNVAPVRRYVEMMRASKADAGKAPNAPFKKSWAMLAFKRVLKLAVEGGYDSVAWAPGQTHVERYDLSEQIGSLEWTQKPDGRYALSASYPEGGRITGGLFDRSSYTADELPRVVGKELARKIVDSKEPTGALSGLDLRVGGEGMIEFYDKALPKEIAKFLKPWAPESMTIDFTDKSESYAAQGFDINQAMRDDIEARGVSLYQQKRGALGVTSITNTGLITQLLEGAADESTMLHELGHVFLLETQAWAATGKASAQTMKDWAILTQWLKAEPGQPLTVDQHEQFAVGFEMYLREGRAPSVELEGPFDMFKQWLRKVYKTVQAIWTRAGREVKLVPEVRRVLDRMFATDVEIEAAATRDGLSFSEDSLDRLGVKPVDRDYIRNLLTQAKEKGKAEFEKRQARENKKNMAAWVESAKAQLETERVYVAMARIRAEGLDRQGVIDLVGEGGMANLAKKIPISVKKEGGADPNQIAADVGYDSGTDMLTDVLGAQSKSDRLRQIVAEKERAPADAKTPEEELLDAAETEEYIAAIGRQLLKKVSPTKMLRSQDSAVGARVVTRAAEQKLLAMPLRDALRVDKFLAAFRTASKRTRDEMGKGDWQKALEHNIQARLQLELTKQSRKLRDEIDANVERVKRALKSTSIDLDYQYNLINTAFRFGLSSRQIPSDGSRMRLAELLTPDEEGGYDVPPVFSGEILDESVQRKYTDLNTGTAQDLFNLLKWLEGTGRQVKSGALLDQKATRDEAAAVLVSSMPATATKILAKSSWVRAIADAARGYLADCRALQFIFRAADGWTKVGEHTRMLWNRLQAGYNEKLTRMEALKTRLEPVTKYLSERGKAWDPSKFTLPAVPELLRKDGRVWTWENVIGVALNRGNTYNAQAVMNGFELSLSDVADITAALTVDDWAAVQEIWDTVDSLWPDLKQTYEDVAIIAPKKVAADPFTVTTSDGVYRLVRGGYFPVSFDPSLALRVEEWTEKDNILNAVQAAFPNPKVPSGYMQARKGTGGLPVQLDYRFPLFKHLDFATSYIGMARILKDIDAITRSKGYAAAFIDRFGVQMYKQIRPALTYVARGSLKGLDVMEGVIRNVGAMGSASAMFGRASTILKQVFDTGSLSNEVGVYNFVSGLLTNATSPVKSIRFIEESSPTMKKRWAESYSGLDEAVKQNWVSKTLPGKLAEGAVNLLAAPFHFFDVLNTSAAWMGSYQAHLKATQNHEEAVHFADNAVTAASPSRRPMDLTAFQRDASAFKILFAPFNSWRIKFQNRLMTTTEGVVSGSLPISDAARFAFLEVFYPAIGWYLLASMLRSFPGAPEPEPKDVGDLLMDVTRSLVGAFPIVGDVGLGVAEKVAGLKSRGEFEPPALKAAKDVTTAVSDAFRPTEEFEEDEQGIFAIKRRLWGLAGAASIILRVPATRLYLDLTEGLRQYEQTGRPGLIFLPDPELRRR